MRTPFAGITRIRFDGRRRSPGGSSPHGCEASLSALVGSVGGPTAYVPSFDGAMARRCAVAAGRARGSTCPPTAAGRSVTFVPYLDTVLGAGSGHRPAAREGLEAGEELGLLEVFADASPSGTVAVIFFISSRTHEALYYKIFRQCSFCMALHIIWWYGCLTHFLTTGQPCSVKESSLSRHFVIKTRYCLPPKEYSSVWFTYLNVFVQILSPRWYS